MPRLLSNCMRAVSHEFRTEMRSGAVWADAHLLSTDQTRGLATVVVDSSLGFDVKRHPRRKKSPAPCTTIFVEAKPVRWKAA